MTPESVGLTQSSLVLGKHSGKHAFSEKLKELGYDLGDNSLMEVFGRFKDLADKKKEIFDEDIIALVGDQSRSASESIKFVDLVVNAGSLEKHEAKLTLEVEDITSQAKGSDPDIIVASAKAYINALNRLIFKKTKSAPDKLSEIKIKGV